ncbi:GSCFA domain-containing protein [Acuticoccus sp. MNP-M23]|uniref:GSCFA domain-containing protein n=1 Tax=Acuticoccus sp. MNP-M23 TaxID=3072793 RepID=UPI00281636D2|nr:GSCFA domain-containing protein [Acuticoccus sp. MNP-M23]WMS41493.1 GSCFA domain-containing protein [Acuticoccus sp. MNP-M23]
MTEQTTSSAPLDMLDIVAGGEGSMSAGEAYRQARDNTARKYPDGADRRLRSGMLAPTLRPSFQLAPGSTVLTIGSCFVRNAEAPLLAAGFDVPASRIDASRDGFTGRANRILNQYNPGTMMQAIADALNSEAMTGGIYPSGDDGKVADLAIASGHVPVTPERAVERRQEIHTFYRDAFAKAETVFITLGLIELWVDLETGIYLNDAPRPKVLKRMGKDRFRFLALTPEQCHRLLTRMLDDIASVGPPKRVLLTVSPVPFGATFSQRDAIVANEHGKATLVLAAHRLAHERAEVDYFPSYEMVRSLGTSAFERDNLHVRDKVVNDVIAEMLAAYVPAAKPLPASGSRGIPSLRGYAKRIRGIGALRTKVPSGR